MTSHRVGHGLLGEAPRLMASRGQIRWAPMKGTAIMANSGSGKRAAARLNGLAGERASIAPVASLPAFDEALGQLEQVVRGLESGQMSLDDALALFERGIRLAQACQQMLDQAELRVRQLVTEEGETAAMLLETEVE
jgi:exodeoxyribonuclease VII small subunit